MIPHTERDIHRITAVKFLSSITKPPSGTRRIFFGGFVSYVELGSLGHWGEWHVKREDGIVGMPEKSVRDEYVKHYVSAFSGAKLMMRRPFSSAEEYGLGLFNDMAGDPEATDEWLGWIENGGGYTQTGEADALSPMRNFGKPRRQEGSLQARFQWNIFAVRAFHKH